MNSQNSVNKPNPSLVIIGPDVSPESAKKSVDNLNDNTFRRSSIGNINRSTDSYLSTESIFSGNEDDDYEHHGDGDSDSEITTDDHGDEFEEDFRKRIINSPDDDDILLALYPVKIRTNKLYNRSFKDVFVKLSLDDHHDADKKRKLSNSRQRGKDARQREVTYSLGEYQHLKDREMAEYPNYGIIGSRIKKVKPDDKDVYPVSFSDFDFYYAFERDEKGDLLKDSEGFVRVTKYDGFSVKCENPGNILELGMYVKPRYINVLFAGDEVQLWEPKFYQGNFREILIEDTSLTAEEYEEVATINQYLSKNYHDLLQEGYVKFTVKNDTSVETKSHWSIQLRTTINPPPKGHRLYVKEFITPYTFSTAVPPEAIREVFYTGIWGNPDRNVMNQIDIQFGPILKVLKKSSLSKISTALGGVSGDPNAKSVDYSSDKSTLPGGGSDDNDLNGEFTYEEREQHQQIGDAITSAVTVLQAAGKATVRFIPVVFEKGGKLVSGGVGKVGGVITKVGGKGGKITSGTTGAIDKVKDKASNVGTFLLKNPAIIGLGGTAVTAGGLTAATVIQVNSDSKKTKGSK